MQPTFVCPICDDMRPYHLCYATSGIAYCEFCLVPMNKFNIVDSDLVYEELPIKEKMRRKVRDSEW